MRQGFDRGVIAGIALLAVLILGIAATSYVNTRRLQENGEQVARNRSVIDAIHAVQFDTVRLQADLRAYLVTGFVEGIPTYEASVARLRSTNARLAEQVADDPEHAPHVLAASQEIEAGIAGFDSAVQMRGRPDGPAAIIALARQRGNRSFVDPLIETLGTMERIERERLATREAISQKAYRNAIGYGILAAILGLVAVAMFVWILRRSISIGVRDAARLTDQRELLAATLTSIGDAVIATDVDGNVTFMNPVAAALTRWLPSVAEGMPLERVFHIVNAATRMPVENPALRALQEGAIVSLANQTLLIARDGTEQPIDDSAAPIKSRGRISGAVLVFRDMTEKKRAEALLIASEERYRVLVTANADVVYRLSADWSELYPLDGRNLVASNITPIRNWMEVNIPEFEHARIREAVARILVTKQPFELEHQVNRVDGTLGWTLSRAAPILDATGNILEWFGTARDVTERKQMEQALRDQDRMKDDFIALLAHELRNPLAPLRTGLQVLRLAGGEGPAIRAREMMDRQLAHMVRLIDDLLDVSRIGRNKMELRRQRVSIAEAVANAIETVRPALDAAGHTLTVTLPPHAVYLDADLTRLSQVFGNLLSNSVKYTERGGQIWLTVASQQSEIVVTVRDTGTGIPATALPTIFDMFSQVDRSLERSTGGLGIGLALVKGLVEMHGGKVSAASDGQGHGSTFTVTLPALAEAPEAAPSPAPDAPPTPIAKRRVLVVDDNRDGAGSLALMLGLIGNEVALAHDGLEAVAQAEEFRPEVILMDIGMPKLNGLDATRQIRAQPWGQGMTIIAVTGWGQDIDRERSRLAGCDGHLVKPISLPALEAMLCERSHMGREYDVP